MKKIFLAVALAATTASGPALADPDYVPFPTYQVPADGGDEMRRDSLDFDIGGIFVILLILLAALA